MKKLTLWLTIIVLVCATVVSFSLAGCKTEEEAVTEEAPEVEREPVTLELWTQHDEAHPTYQAMVKAADIAKEKYNITVNIVLKGIAGLADSTAAAAMSQSGADLIYSMTGEAGIIANGKRGLYLPINDLLTQEEIDDLVFIDSCTDPETGDIYGSAFVLFYSGFAYNKSLFDQAGIDYSNFPTRWSWKEFVDISDKLKNAGINASAFANMEGYMGAWWPSFFVPTFFDNPEDIAEAWQKPTYKEPFITFLQNWKDYYQKGYFYEGGATIGIVDYNAQFTNGEAAITAMGAANVGVLTDALGVENVGLIEWAAMGDGKIANMNFTDGGEALGITKWTEYPEEALLYLKTLLYDEEVIAEYLKAGNLPIPKSVKIDTSLIENPEVAAYMERHREMETLTTVPAPSPVFSETNWKFNNLMLQGEISIEEFCAEIDAVLE